jgi:PAS domain-containing protein
MVANIRIAADGRYLDADDDALELFGVSRADFLAAGVGDFAGPYGDIARRVWHRLAGAGDRIPTGEASIYRPDGSIRRVRYARIERDADGCYDLAIEPVGDGAAPPVVDDVPLVLEEWRVAERSVQRDGLPAHGDGVDGLRMLYQHGVAARMPSGRRPSRDEP